MQAVETPQILFETLSNLLQNPFSVEEEVSTLGRSPLLEEHEVAWAAHALLTKKPSLSTDLLNPLPSGVIPLFSKGFFLWKGLPYPKEHALLGAHLVRLGMRERAEKMALFQQAACDHHKKPIHPLFSQEGGVAYQALEEAFQTFFKALDLPICEELRFFDHDLGIAQERTKDKTILFTGSGCKSGMGTVLFGDVGILTCGPQFLPIGDCSSFGLAGRPYALTLKEEAPCGFTLSYRTHLAAPHPRHTGYSGLTDSGYSGAWIEATIEAHQEEICCIGSIKSFKPLEAFAFSFFCKASACYVAGSHKLNPRSLDRYQGPPQQIELKGQTGSVCIGPEEGFSQMEIIPLAADESFWGADFLIACTFSSPSFRFNIGWTR